MEKKETSSQKEIIGMIIESNGNSTLSKKYYCNIEKFVERMEKHSALTTPLDALGRVSFDIYSCDFVGLAMTPRILEKDRSKIIRIHWKIAITNTDEAPLHTTSGKYRYKEDNENGVFPIVEIPLCSLEDIRKFLGPSGILRMIFELRFFTASEDPVELERKSRTKELVRDLKQLWLSGDASDVTIRVKGRDFPVHSCILSTRTPVFASMFKHDMSEKETGLVVIEDCSAETFEMFLKYAYSGCLEDTSPGDARELYRVAHKYQVDELKEDCLDLIENSLSVDNFCNTIILGDLYGETDLVRLATEFFVKNAKEILATVEWLQYLARYPTQANKLFLKTLLSFEAPCLRK